MLTGYSKFTAQKISEGYVPGGYQKLKESYPKRFQAMEDDLEANWGKEALDKYRERLIKGLIAVGAWNEQT